MSRDRVCTPHANSRVKERKTVSESLTVSESTGEQAQARERDKRSGNRTVTHRTHKKRKKKHTSKDAQQKEANTSLLRKEPSHKHHALCKRALQINASFPRGQATSGPFLKKVPNCLQFSLVQFGTDFIWQEILDEVVFPPGKNTLDCLFWNQTLAFNKRLH